jgi:hypothetical protein
MNKTYHFDVPCYDEQNAYINLWLSRPEALRIVQNIIGWFADNDPENADGDILVTLGGKLTEYDEDEKS